MNASALRILDANANRAREALRVVEDYARFALNDDELCGQLKQIRHDFAEATKPFLAEAVLHRDTPGDVGTQVKTSAELQRADLNAVVTAAGKRLGEAFRAVEEVTKVLQPQSALQIEALRYRFYSVEQILARTLQPTACGLAELRLYVLITEDLCAKPWLETAQLAIEGGATCLQLREKTMEGGEFLHRAKQLVGLCRKHGIKSIINDRADIAVLSDADGVHVGQGDLPCIEARKIVGPNKIVGVSTHNIDQARQAVRDGANYIGVGPVFPSKTKPRDFLPGLDYARQAAKEISIPSVAIAGITLENLPAVVETGIRAVAVSSAIISATDIRAAASAFKEKLTVESR